LRVSLSGVTVRSILDEVASQHRAMSWVAEYTDSAGGYAGLKLSFIGFDNWSTVLAARTAF